MLTSSMLQAQTCIGGVEAALQIQDATSCWPPAASFSPTPTPPFYGWGFYSPGLVCPSGYVSACTATAGGSSGWNMEYAMQSGETAVGCCPSGYTCGSYNHAQTCISVAQSGGSIPVVTCSNGYSQGYSYLTIPATETVSGMSSSSSRVGEYDLSSFVVYNPMVEIRWQSTDRSEPIAEQTASSKKTHTPSRTGSNTPSKSTLVSSQSAGLSTGTKAAIGVVVPVAVIAVLGGIFFFWRRKIRKLKSSEWPNPPTNSNDQGLDGSNQNEHRPAEMRANERPDGDRGVYAASLPRELEGSLRPHELEGSKISPQSNG